MFAAAKASHAGPASSSTTALAPARTSTPTAAVAPASAQVVAPAPAPATASAAPLRRLENVQLSDLRMITTLGVGSYGVVKLVEHKATKTPMALKILSKAFVARIRQQRQVLRESSVYHTVDFVMVGHLYATLQDKCVACTRRRPAFVFVFRCVCFVSLPSPAALRATAPAFCHFR